MEKYKNRFLNLIKSSYDSHLTLHFSGRKYQTCLGILKLPTKNTTNKIWVTIKSSSQNGY